MLMVILTDFFSSGRELYCGIRKVSQFIILTPACALSFHQFIKLSDG